MSRIVLQNLGKVYEGGVEAVKDFNLEIEDQEFIIFVGPSGCGKSTTLRMIAGLEEITVGELYIDDKLMNHIDVKDRDIAMVFQNYALYPHMTVYDNMAFGLRMRKTPKEEIGPRIKEAAKILKLQSLLKRKPKALSGGEKQRVAMGRVMVREPKLFLMDEPLSNLDAKLRVQMRHEIASLHRRLGATIIYVTHDQVEAMTLGTRIVVMKDGEIQQADTPQNLYNRPGNLFVAGFIGSPQMNFLEGLVRRGNQDHFVLEAAGYELLLPENPMLQSYIGRKIIAGIRPEDIKLNPNAKDSNRFDLPVERQEYLGAETYSYARIGNTLLAARSLKLGTGEVLRCAIPKEKLHLFEAEKGMRI